MARRWTIDELARDVGMTARNIREHQTRGLLPPPQVEGRVGWYDENHLARLRLIKDLQAEGLNLQAIVWLLERAPADDVDELTRLKQALFAPWTDEVPAVYTTDELAERLGPTVGGELDLAVSLGVLRPAGEDRWEAPSPRLLEAGEQLARLGIPLEEALDVVAKLQGAAGTVARTFIDLFLRRVWGPFEEAGMPDERWPEVRDALERLRPLASDALLATFQQVMGAAIEGEVADKAVEIMDARDSA